VKREQEGWMIRRVYPWLVVLAVVMLVEYLAAHYR
jgi:hypothetical protein